MKPLHLEVLVLDVIVRLVEIYKALHLAGILR